MNDDVFLPVGTVLALVAVRNSVWVNEVVLSADCRRWIGFGEVCQASWLKPEGVAS